MNLMKNFCFGKKFKDRKILHVFDLFLFDDIFSVLSSIRKKMDSPQSIDKRGTEKTRRQVQTY